MSLSPLEPGMSPQQVEKLRWETFGHKRALSLRSSEQVVQFTVRRGFVLLLPQPGVHYPSVLEAAVGRPLLDFTWDERVANLQRWKEESVAARQLICTPLLAGRETLVAPAYLADFYALCGNRGDLEDHLRRHAAGQLGQDAATVCSTLAQAGVLSAPELQARAELGGQSRQGRFAQALAEAERRFLLVQVDFRGSGSGPSTPVYDLLPRAFPAEVGKARGTTPAQARQRIACRYLRNVLLEGSHEIAQVLGWSAEDTLAALQALVAKKMAIVHPASRPQRHLFQATATDLLQDTARKSSTRAKREE